MVINLCMYIFFSFLCGRTLIENSCSASLGAVCHELCHTFDLGHTVEGIMGKDFDRVCSLFRVPECVNETMANLVKVNCTRNDSLVICEGIMGRKLNINFSVADTRNANVLNDADGRLREQPQRRINLNEIPRKDGFWFGGCATLLAYHRYHY